MVVSVNPEPSIEEFSSLLSKTVDMLTVNSKKEIDKYSKLLGNKLEYEVRDILTEISKGTPFENSIELVSGQKFPDIVAHRFYGVEVKSTKSNHWRSVGSSVAEGTRVSDVERIYMLFGKMGTPIDFLCRPYEDCLSDVVVTHSPRYLIDMNLKQGETFFDKINIPYDELRKDNPIDKVLKYYRSQLKPGENTWWLGESEIQQESSMIIRVWNNLTKEESTSYIVKGFCLFPELLSNHSSKFNRFAVWLSTRKGIVCPNVRDNFTAGGTKLIHIGDFSANVPQIVSKLQYNLALIKAELFLIDIEELEEYWECEINDLDKLYDMWVNLVVKSSPDNLKRILSKVLES